jgi:hypothetical protein
MMLLNQAVYDVLSALPADACLIAKEIHLRVAKSLSKPIGLASVTQALVLLEARGRVRRRPTKPTQWRIVRGETV